MPPELCLLLSAVIKFSIAFQHFSIASFSIFLGGGCCKCLLGWFSALFVHAQLGVSVILLYWFGATVFVSD